MVRSGAAVLGRLHPPSVRRQACPGGAPKPGPGSVVTVPAKPEREPLDVTAFLGNVAQVIAGTVAIVVLATR